MTTTEPDITPPGVKLHDWDDFKSQRQAIFDNVKTTMAKQFPVSMKGVRLELHDLDYHDEPEEFSLEDQKKALLGNKFLHRRLKGTWKLVNEATGEPIEEKKATVLRVPYLTDRGTFIHNGSEYVTFRQARLLPGVYTRRKNNGELEAHFNAKRGTGNSFRVRLEPETGIFKLDIQQASLRLYSLLKDLGVPDDHLEKKWGKELLDTNRNAYDARVFDKAYHRLVRYPKPEAKPEEKAQAIRDALGATMLDRNVVSRTLPNLFNPKLASAAVPWQGVAPEVAPPHTEMKKEDLELLALLLDQKFNAGIPLDASTEQLVAAVMEEVQKLMPDTNPGMLGQSLQAQNPG